MVMTLKEMSTDKQHRRIRDDNCCVFLFVRLEEYRATEEIENKSDSKLFV